MLLGLAAVALFSLTLPMTRMAVAELDPLFVALARAVGAALLAGAWLRWKGVPRRRARPCRHWPWSRSDASSAFRC
jgi:drug/metabolite transporter (DMT)-like permease